MIDNFEVMTCADLGAFNPIKDDCALGKFLDNSRGLLDKVVIMEDREPNFFLTYREDDSSVVPMNRHGPRDDVWKQRDLKRLVDSFHENGIEVLIGFWVHECKWIDERHPELLMRRSTGSLWRDPVAHSADFNPLKGLSRDLEFGIEEGSSFSEYALSQYRGLEANFGFDGLFIGDGGMGFREYGDDRRGLRYFDYSDKWINEFIESAYCEEHDLCPLKESASVTVKARDIWAHHWADWTRFNCDRWTRFYEYISKGVHALGGKLAAYTCMNYGPCIAINHGIDYKAIANAGLDYLVFQTYDYAWGPYKFDILSKDITTNLFELLCTKAYIGKTRTKLLFTTEVGDRVEGWKSPIAHTLGETYTYANTTFFDGERKRSCVDGTLMVWGNFLEPWEWELLLNAYRNITIFAEREISEWHIPRPFYHGNMPKFKILMWDDKSVESVLETVATKQKDVYIVERGGKRGHHLLDTVATEQKDVYAYHEPTKKKVMDAGGFIGWIVRREDSDRINAEPVPVLCKSMKDLDEGVSDASRRTDDGDRT